MSVLACNRSDCDAIMCDRLILKGHAYICEGCWEELLIFKETWAKNVNVRQNIEHFMFQTTPGTYTAATIDEQFVEWTSG